MSAPIRPHRVKAARARILILDEVIRLFEADVTTMSRSDLDLKRELLLRMAANTLPRLNEITGEDGEALQITYVNYADTPIQVPTPPVSDSPTESV